ncbi:competence/damage-inducible protein A [Archaeoglobales archaeon]|nr:MAG: competence/damage-inducible protein A [Archaeoglobales archaeon]
MNFIIISVGNEILSGDIVNTNAAYMAKMLSQKGHKVSRIIVVPDVIDEIAEEVKNASKKADFVLVTGGLGATHDDVTAEGVAKALNRKLVLNEYVAEMIRQLSSNEEAIKKVASLPEGCEIIENDVGVAPGFVVENVAVMPGVPAEMENVFGKLIERFGERDYFEETLKVEGYEERILNKLNLVVNKFKDVQIGSYPKPGYVVIKFSGGSKEEVERAKNKLAELLKE